MCVSGCRSRANFTSLFGAQQRGGVADMHQPTMFQPLERRTYMTTPKSTDHMITWVVYHDITHLQRLDLVLALNTMFKHQQLSKPPTQSEKLASENVKSKNG